LKKIRVLLTDDHPLLLDGTRAFVERDPACEVCAVAHNGAEALELTAQHQPDVVVLDVHLPDSDGLTIARTLREQHPEIEIVMYTGQRGEEMIEALFRSGVKSVIAKTEPSEMLIAAIKAAAEHQTFITPAVSDIIFRMAIEGGPRVAITPREREVLRLVAQGHTNKEIATHLQISPRTAEVHRAALMQKTGATSTAELVRYAIRNAVLEA
jgi:DNA-binding NarL/FixJ family response regulator